MIQPSDDFHAGLRRLVSDRGVWEAIDSAGPACGVQTSEDDVDRYLDVLDRFLRELLHANG